MNGRTILASESFLMTVADPNWQVAGIGDFDGDGMDDILWRNASTGENYIYFMDGKSIKSTEGYVRTVAVRTAVGRESATSTGDGKDDILWKRRHRRELHLFHGRQDDQRARVYPHGARSELADRRHRRLRRRTARPTSCGATQAPDRLHLADGCRTIKPSEGFLRTVSDTRWEVKGVGDFDGDGKADIMWRHTRDGRELYLSHERHRHQADRGLLGAPSPI